MFQHVTLKTGNSSYMAERGYIIATPKSKGSGIDEGNLSCLFNTIIIVTIMDT